MHDLVFFETLAQLGLGSKQEFSITNDMLNLFINNYSKFSQTSGNIGKNTNVLYAKKLAALSFIKYKKENKLRISEGFVYCISNPAWKDLYKIGMTQDTKARLAQYQTYSPLRDYKLEHWSFWFDKRKGEKLIHDLFIDIKDYEWFSIKEKELTPKLTLINLESKNYLVP